MQKPNKNKVQEEEDIQIDPADLLIMEDDEIEEPTEEDVIEYADYLGFDIENYQELSLGIAYNALSSKLPENYKRAYYKSPDGKIEKIFYIDVEEGQIHEESPLDLLAIETYQEEMNKLQKGKGKKKVKSEKKSKEQVKGKKTVFDDSSEEIENDTDEEKFIPEPEQRQDTYDYQAEDSYEQSIKKNIKNENIHIDIEDDFLQKKSNKKLESNDLEQEKKRRGFEEVFTPKQVDIKEAIDIGKNYQSNILNNLKDDSSEKKKLKLTNLENNKDKVIENNEHFIDEDNYDQYDAAFDNNTEENKDEEEKSNNSSKLVINVSVNSNYNKNQTETKTDNIFINDNLAELAGNEKISNDTYNKEIIDEKIIQPQQSQTLTKISPCKSVHNSFEENSLEKSKNDKAKIYNIENSYSDNLVQLKKQKALKEKQEKYELEKESEFKAFESDLKKRKIEASKVSNNKRNEISKQLNNKMEKLRHDLEIVNKNIKKDKEEELTSRLNLNLENYKKFIKAEDSLQKNKDKNDEKIIALQEQRRNIIEEIDLYRRLTKSTKNRQTEKFDGDLKIAKEILREKFDLNKKNLENKFKILEEEIKIEEENRHNRELDELRKDILFNLEKQEAQFMCSVGKLLEEYNKAMEEEFDLESKKILKQTEEEFDSKINRFKSDHIRDSKSKENLYSNSLKDLELKYFTNLQFIREEYKIKSEMIEKRLNMKFTDSQSTYDKLKNRIIKTTDNLYYYLLSSYETQTKVDNCYDIMDKLQTKYEQYSIGFTSKKSQFTLLEIELRNKIFSYEYFLKEIREVVNYINEKDLIGNLDSYNYIFYNMGSHNDDPQNPRTIAENGIKEITKKVINDLIYNKIAIRNKSLFEFIIFEDFYKNLNENKQSNRSTTFQFHQSSSKINENNKRPISIQELDGDGLFSDRTKNNSPDNKFDQSINRSNYENNITVNRYLKDNHSHYRETEKHIDNISERTKNDLVKSYSSNFLKENKIINKEEIINQLLTVKQRESLDKIFDFIEKEEELLIILSNNLSQRINKLDNLRNSVYGTSLRNFSSNNYTSRTSLISYVDILEEDQMELNRKEHALNSAKDIFYEIKNIAIDLQSLDYMVDILRNEKANDIFDTVLRMINEYYLFLDNTLINDLKENKIPHNYSKEILKKNMGKDSTSNILFSDRVDNFIDSNHYNTTRTFNTTGMSSFRQNNNYNTIKNHSSIEEVKRRIDAKINLWKKNKF